MGINYQHAQLTRRR